MTLKFKFEKKYRQFKNHHLISIACLEIDGSESIIWAIEKIGNESIVKLYSIPPNGNGYLALGKYAKKRYYFSRNRNAYRLDCRKPDDSCILSAKNGLPMIALTSLEVKLLNRLITKHRNKD